MIRVIISFLDFDVGALLAFIPDIFVGVVVVFIDFKLTSHLVLNIDSHNLLMIGNRSKSGDSIVFAFDEILITEDSKSVIFRVGVLFFIVEGIRCIYKGCIHTTLGHGSRLLSCHCGSGII
jgi:hypothetical protein